MDSKLTSLASDPIAFPAPRPKGRKKASTEAQSKPLNLQPLPSWVALSVDATFTSGAALMAIDQIMRDDPPWLGCWRMRQALKASVVFAKLLRLNADEAALRDADCLTRPGDDPGPAGRLYRLVRQFAARPVHLADGSLKVIAEEIKGAVAGGEVLALLQADLALAKKLGWSKPLLLGATMVFDPSLRSPTGQRPSADDPRLLATAALNAHANAVTLERQAQKLSEAAAGLRTRDGGKGLAQVLGDDCVAPWRMVDVKGLSSDRAARRFCETLAGQGVLRLLTNRPTFRLYGL